MEQKIKEDIVNILKDGLAALKAKDSMDLREISDHSLHNASIFQDKDSISIAVIMYALSKITDRMARIEQEVVEALQNAKSSLENKDIQSYEDNIKHLIDTISGFDKKLNLYMQRVINEAEIKKGSRIYEHGISLAQTAELLGITQWELMKYLGQTKIADKFEEEIDVKQRLEHTRKLFDLK